MSNERCYLVNMKWSCKPMSRRLSANKEVKSMPMLCWRLSHHRQQPKMCRGEPEKGAVRPSFWNVSHHPEGQGVVLSEIPMSSKL